MMSKSRQKAPAPEPDIHIHYLGHSSFILQFDNGITVLTDYGASNSCGFF
jgi:L-ascorbate metabolism protein UlaG (beta-lactamase superfamily)